MASDGFWRLAHRTGRSGCAFTARWGPSDPRPHRCGSCASGSWGIRRVRRDGCAAELAGGHRHRATDSDLHARRQAKAPSTAHRCSAELAARARHQPGSDGGAGSFQAECKFRIGQTERYQTDAPRAAVPLHGDEHLHGRQRRHAFELRWGALPRRRGPTLEDAQRHRRSLLGVPELLRIQTVIRLDELRPRAQDRGGSRRQSDPRPCEPARLLRRRREGPSLVPARLSLLDSARGSRVVPRLREGRRRSLRGQPDHRDVAVGQRRRSEEPQRDLRRTCRLGRPARVFRRCRRPGPSSGPRSLGKPGRAGGVGRRRSRTMVWSVQRGLRDLDGIAR